ncbi:MAG: Zn-dependent hydrolase [Tissierellia bacterium]|nr:Zn-dependent hydrolase [Tissierellia bacterium]
MKINSKRLRDNFEKIIRISATEMGCTRYSYSKEDIEVRRILKKQLTDLQMAISIDGMGNIRAKYNPMKSKKSSIMVGSHIDTVPKGGKYDGLIGVLTALEAIQSLNDSKINLSRPIELIIFSEEEGSNFGITMLGSKTLVGILKYEDLILIKDFNGKPLTEIVEEAGFGINADESLEIKDIPHAMIELHIEQGAILEKSNIPIGIVENIVGMDVMKVNIKGISNHAGTTPMDSRKDPMVAASKIISEIPRYPQLYGGNNSVSTVGKISAKPNVSNVIANEVEFYVDIRDVERKNIENIYNNLEKNIGKLCESSGLEFEIDKFATSMPVPLSDKIVNEIEKASKQLDIPYHKMVSGAVHDAAMMAERMDVGMIFLPSIGGISHSPDEDTKFEDIEQGTRLLLQVLVNLANQ